MTKTLRLLVFAVIILVCLGLVVLLMASTERGQFRHGDPYFFWIRQLRWVVPAGLVGIVVSRFDYHYWKKYTVLPIVFYVAIVLLLVTVLLFGTRLNGAKRWLSICGVSCQPGEFSKLAIVVACSVWMDRIGWRSSNFWRGALVPFGLLGGIVLLLLPEPDLGATLVVGVLAVGIMFVAGVKIWHMAAISGGGLLALPLGYLLIAGKESFQHFVALRLMRVAAWMGVTIGEEGLEAIDLLAVQASFKHITAYRLIQVAAWLGWKGEMSLEDIDLQQTQSVLAFKLGGLWGTFFQGQGRQKFSYLPEAYSDFIFAIGGEEFGFFFSIIVIILYATVLICGLLISAHAPDRLGRLLAFGMTLLLVFQAAFNIGVVTKLLPNKGLALPFFSSGGSNLVVALFAVGTLVNIGMHIGVFDERMHTDVVRDAVDTV